MAQLLTWLASAGARTSAGDPVASGFAWFYEVGGGTTQTSVYTDVDGTVIASQPVTLDAAGRATIYTIGPARVLIQDATGADVSDLDEANVTRVEAVQVDNASWSGDWLSDVLTALGTSTGGTDGQYKESSGATARTIKSKFAEIWISVKDFGAKGDGLTVDTTAIQAALNRVAALGGGTVYFPPGTYIIDQLLSNTVTGVSLKGAGSQVSILKGTNTTLGLLAFTGSNGFSMADMRLTNATTSTGKALSLTTCSKVLLTDLLVDGYYTGIYSSNTDTLTLIACTSVSPSAASTAGRPLKLDSSTSTVRIFGGEYVGPASGGYDLEVVSFIDTLVSTGAYYPSQISLGNGGRGVSFIGNNIAFGFVFGGSAMPDNFCQVGNGPDGNIGSLVSGATFTPSLGFGWNVTIDATSTGSAYTVNVPTPAPSTTGEGTFMTLTFRCHAGAPITGWGVAAGYHLSAGPSTVDGNRTTYLLHWDTAGSVWREVSRSVTT